jgi:hypothetical protein
MSLPFKTDFPPPDDETAQRWLDALNGMDVATLRALLAQHNGGPRSSISIGTVLNMTKGFAYNALAHRERLSDRSEKIWRWIKIIIASVTAVVAIIGVISTVQKWF